MTTDNTDTGGWDLAVGECITSHVVDGTDVVLRYADGSIVRAHNAKDIRFTVECLPDPDYSV